MNIRATFIAATACTLLMATGCVIEPLDGDSIADRHYDDFEFAGYAYSPGDEIEIQVWDYDQQRWEYLTHTYAETYYFNWSGLKLYPWNAGSVHIPHHFSEHYWKKISGGGHWCELRAVSSSGSALYTFDQNYPGLNSALSMTAGQLVGLAGNGTSLTVFSDN